MMGINDLLKPYGIIPIEVKKLAGYDSTNYMVTDDTGKSYVLKYYSDPNELPIIREEIDIINKIKGELPFELSETLVKNNRAIHHYKGGNYSRLLPFIEGKFLAEVEPSPMLLQSFGSSLARFDKALMSVNAPNIAARHLRWDLKNTLLNKPLIKFIPEPERRNLIHYFYDQFEQFTLPVLTGLKQQIIHNDWNDWNVLSRDDHICGLIDFGDMTCSPRICELAIGLAYMMMNKELPISVACEVIKGYCNELPLSIEEIGILPNLIVSRICVSVSHSAKAKSESSDTEYILISEKAGWNLIEKWIKWNPIILENSFLKAAGLSDNIPKPSKEKMLNVRSNNFSGALGLSYKEPIFMSSAAFQYMYDMDGNTYLDAYNNIPLVGHSHPKVSEAVSRQIRKLNTNTRYHSESLYRYAEKLLGYFPDHLNKVFFVNSGTEANSLAQRLAMNYTEKSDQIVMEMGYHGHSTELVNLSAYKYNGPGGKGKRNHVCELPLPREYKGKYENALEYLTEAKTIIETEIANGKEFHSLLVEPISGCGGQVPLIEGYLSELVLWLKEKKIITISDEVQLGFGRLGNWFWGFEYQKFSPDIVVLGKPMGNGFPLAGVVTTSAIADNFDNGMEFFSSFGGSPLSTEAGLAVLEILEEEDLQRRAQETGYYFKMTLKELQKNHKIIGDVRGEGLFLGIEFTNVDESPGSAICEYVNNKLKENYILTGCDGKYEEVLKMKPPLCFNKENVDLFVGRLDKILNSYEPSHSSKTILI